MAWAFLSTADMPLLINSSGVAKPKKLNKPKKDELNELVILRDGFDPKTSFKK